MESEPLRQGNKSIKRGVIFVCDDCLKELVVPDALFQPLKKSCGLDTGWGIPWTVHKYIMDCGDGTQAEKTVEVAASSIKSLCPACKLV